MSSRFEVLVGVEVGAAVYIWLALVGIPSAAACPPPDCVSGGLHEAGERIPSNTDRIVWEPRRQNGAAGPEVDRSHVELSRSVDGTPQEVPVEVTQYGPRVYVEPINGFVARGDYRFRGADFCYDNGRLEGAHHLDATFSTGSTASFGDSLGALEVADSAIGGLKVAGIGVCEAEAEADQVATELRMSEPMRSWSGLLFYETQIRRPGTQEWRTWSTGPAVKREDAERQPPSTAVDWKMPGALLYRVCQSEESVASRGLEPGDWEVRMVASRPLKTKTWTSSSVTVTVGCPSGGDTGVDAGDTGGADSDVGSGDLDVKGDVEVEPDATDAAGATGGDLGSDVDSELDGRRSDAVAEPGGCGCSAPRPGNGGPLPWFFAGGLILMVRSRRR